MASFQVEIASPSPFGSVLRDHNQGDRCRESNARAAFKKNLRELVRDHFSTCMPIENSQNQPNDPNGCWVGDRRRNNHQNVRFTSNTDTNDNNTTTTTISDESLGMSPRQSRILDRWAARQAREMVSTIEIQTQEAELQAAPNSRTNSDVSVDISNLGASSLVQMWEARLNRSNSLNMNSTIGSSRTNSGLNTEENTSLAEDGDSADEREESQSSMNERSFGEWESDRRCPSEPHSHSDAGESETVRVADIIRRLTLANRTQTDDNEHDHSASATPRRERERSSSPFVSPPQMRESERSIVQIPAEQRSSSQVGSSQLIRRDQPEQRVTFENISLSRIRGQSSTSDQAGQKNLSQAVCSPRIRGRQAFNDLLMHMERDRHKELDHLIARRAVSGFQQRGRIQSMLRLKFLQHGLAGQEQRQLHSTGSNSIRSQGSTITLLRERFDTRVEHGGVTVRTNEVDSSYPRGEIPNNNQDTGISSTLSQSIEENRHQEVNTTQEQCTTSAGLSETYASADFHEETSLSSDVTWQEVSFEASNVDTQEITDNSWDENLTAEDQEADSQQHIGTSYDWFSDISRPRIYWEGRRQAWYQEMLDSSSENEEIRQLLERRRVSSFLASDFRQTMDQLMMSRLEQQPQLPSSQEVEEQDEVGRQERMDHLMMSFSRRHTLRVGSHEAEREREEFEEADEIDEEEESSTGCQYHEISGYLDQTPSFLQLPSPSSVSSWCSYRDQVNDDSDQAASASLHQPLSTQSYYQETQGGCSSTSRPSLEMELIYDLRGQMEQLHQEMSELRKSIKSCMDMQMKMQQSFRQEDHSVRGVGKKSINGAPRKDSCCICYEMQVDSLLYRCGHMCTCLKCAHELQWSSGKCPICRAPIVDVVRAYADS